MPDLLPCVALVLTPTPAEMGSVNGEATCLHLDIDAAARVAYALPDTGSNPSFGLRRARTEIAIDHAGWAQARVAFMPVRSGGDGGYIGVDGESILPRFQIAEARLAWRKLGLIVAGGLVDDPWAITGNGAWGNMMGVAAPLPTATGWVDRSDLGAMAAWTSPGNLVSVSVTGLSGEGADLSEQDDHINTTGVIIVRPLGAVDEDKARWLELSVMGREGTKGVDSARAHRLGVRAATVHPWVTAGAEYLAAWGIGDDASRTPWGASAYANVHPPGVPVRGFARLDYVNELPDADEGARTALHAGVGFAPMPLARGWLGVSHAARGEDAAELAGAPTSVTTLFLQIDVRLHAALPVPDFGQP